MTPKTATADTTVDEPTEDEVLVANRLAEIFEGDDGEKIHLGIPVDPDERETEYGLPRAIGDDERQRVIDFLIGPMESLTPYHQNPRRGDVPTIANSLEHNGQFKPIVVNRGSLTGRRNEVLAGNHTLLGAGENGWRLISRTYVDVDDDEARKIVLADNRTSDLGSYDNGALVDVLQSVPDLEGTGYSQIAFEEILKGYQAASGVEPAAPGAFPEIKPDDLETEYECPQCHYGWRGKPKP